MRVSVVEDEHRVATYIGQALVEEYATVYAAPSRGGKLSGRRQLRSAGLLGGLDEIQFERPCLLDVHEGTVGGPEEEPAVHQHAQDR